METSYRKQFSCALYNPKTSKTVQFKQFTLEVTKDSTNVAWFDSLGALVDTLVDRFDGKHVIEVHNTDLIRLLEPKTGATVHRFLETLQRDVIGTNTRLLGNTIPSDTVNGDKVLVLGPEVRATMEGLANYFLTGLDAKRVLLSDGTYSVVTYESASQPSLL